MRLRHTAAQPRICFLARRLFAWVLDRLPFYSARKLLIRAVRSDLASSTQLPDKLQVVWETGAAGGAAAGVAAEELLRSIQQRAGSTAAWAAAAVSTGAAAGRFHATPGPSVTPLMAISVVVSAAAARTLPARIPVARPDHRSPRNAVIVPAGSCSR